MKDRLVILGCGSCNLVPDKAAASVLIEKGDARLVYDFGRGVAIRLTELGLKQDEVEHIFISHFHPDHVTDLYPYLHAASWSQIDRRRQDLNIYGPPGTKIFIEKMFSVFDWKSELGRGFTVTVHEVVGGKLDIANQHFEVSNLHHSQGLRFGPYAIAGDASISNDLISLLKDAKIGIFDSGHITDEEIVELALHTQAQTLVCSHQYRELNEQRLNEAAKAKGYKGQLIVAKDLLQFNL
jgi:ribonuclease BN (tRNA processing enzyme)